MTQTSDSKGERYTNAVLFSGFLDAAKRLGLEEVICQSAPPELVAMFKRPPLPTAMIPGALCDKFYEAVVAAKGRPTLRQVAFESMRDRGGQLLRSMFGSMMKLFGDGPEALFNQVDMIMSAVTANIEVKYLPESPRSGVISIRPTGRPAPLSYAIWEGYFEYFFEVSKTRGQVEITRLEADGLSGTIRVSW
jgi:hypothetical protein